MRRPSAYEMYLYRLRKYYEIKHLECPVWVDKAKKYYCFLAQRPYREMCSDTAIPKAVMAFLSRLSKDELDDIPEELVAGASENITVLKEMYRELISDKDLCFINEWTLSKKGRRVMRGFVDRIPSAYEIMPPENEFTNVPGSISFSNRIYKAEYELTVTLDGSRICLRNGDKDFSNNVYIDFTERFLDKIIPTVQWERFDRLNLRAIDWKKERDETVYQDFKTVFFEIDRYEYDLNLFAPDKTNPFIDVLKLVWDEYGDVLKEKDLVLPWFHLLDWV